MRGAPGDPTARGTSARGPLELAVLVAVPVALRLVAVALVVDTDADGYSRMLIAERLADALRDGQATWGSLYVPVWPPAWALACALVELAWPDPVLAPRALSALFGGATAPLVFLLARRLVRGTPAAGGALPWLAWGIATALPLHVVYSASAMTEAFTGFWVVLGALLLVHAGPARPGWVVLAALALLPATLTRFDAWVLVPVVPAIAWWQRRAGATALLAATAVAGAGPAAWIALAAAATGDPLHFLGAHGGYVTQFFQVHPIWGDRGLVGVGVALGALVLGTGVGLLALAGTGLGRTRSADARALLAIVLAFVGFLLALWAVKRVVGWRRHYLPAAMLLAAAVPLGVLALGAARRRLVAALLAVDLVVGAAGLVTLGTAGRLTETARFVRGMDGVVYSDEPAVQVLSGLPSSRFVDGARLPAVPEAALDVLRRAGVRWVVATDVDYSPLPRLFPPLARGDDVPPFRRVHVAPARWGAPAIFVYALVSDAS